MNLSPSEQLTLNFYRFESKGRGYYHYPFCVDIEPPFEVFEHKLQQNNNYDDGRVPSLLNQFKNLLLPKAKEEYIEEEIDLIPKQANGKPQLVTFEISYSKKQGIDKGVSLQFLNMLSFSEHIISFEIIGTENKITIQITCGKADKIRIESLLRAYFPTIITQEKDSYDFSLNGSDSVAICDFGLEEEFMRTLKIPQGFNIDSFTSIFATLETLQGDDMVIFQVLFKGVSHPWSKSILNAITDFQGNSFFPDAPEMLISTKTKISNPLFAVVMRIACQSTHKNKSEYLAKEMIRNISLISKSEYNKIIPLSNEGYNFNNHIENLFSRQTNRLGMILNSEELLNFVHYPNENISSSKLGYNISKTKKVPQFVLQGDYKIGVNQHNNEQLGVYLSDEQLVQHTHIIGATGVGKSTLLANLTLEKIDKGRGVALFDPHGDIVDDILLRIPEHRKNDVVLIDPTDSEYSIGFNLLEANSDAEKIVLSSDLVSAFKQQASAWGDNMTAVLSNAINTFLESSKKGTLIELKRFLIEDTFRNDFLKSVDDEALHYYWKYEFPMVKKGIAPLLTRIDTFLRPKVIRYMFAQKEGVDFKKCVEENKIILIKLSQGLIGEENSFLLGSLFISKLNQVALGRQSLSKDERIPYYIVMDEFHSIMTPSISSILTSARKYSVGLVLAHQSLRQIQNPQILDSVISNPFTRICFRLGDNDAKILEKNFSYFEQNDLTNLDVGEAIVKVGKNSNDFNLKTYPFSTEINEDIKTFIIKNTRDKYTKRSSEIKDLLNSLLPKSFIKQNIEEVKKPTFLKNEDSVEEEVVEHQNTGDVSEKEKQNLIEREEKSIRHREHTSLQTTIKKLGQQYGFLSTIEKETKSGGRVDVALEKESIKIACEISVTNSTEYEVENIKKCLNEGYNLVLMVSNNESHLEDIKKLSIASLSKVELKRAFFIKPDEVSGYLNITTEQAPKTEVVKGFRVTTEYENQSGGSFKSIRESIARILVKNRK